MAYSLLTQLSRSIYANAETAINAILGFMDVVLLFKNTTFVEVCNLNVSTSKVPLWAGVSVVQASEALVVRIFGFDSTVDRHAELKLY